MDNLSLVLKLVLCLIENCLWSISKPDIWILFPYRFVEVRGRCDGCVVALAIIHLLDDFKAIISRFNCWVFLSVFS